MDYDRKQKEGKNSNIINEVKIFMEKEENRSFSFYVLAFLTYCFIGWIYEVIWEAAIGNGFVNRGFLFGPYLPIYGFGVLTLFFILRKLMKKKIRIFNKINITPLIVFIAILIIASSIEYFASFVMELLFHKRWWDYSYDKFNLNGRISLRNSSLLASGGFLLVYFVQPVLNKVFSKFNSKVIKIISIIVVITMFIDFIVTILGYVI